jgi:hypothetical protein
MKTISTNRIVMGLAVRVLIVIGFYLYCSTYRNNLNVTPDAAEEIERAKRQ